MLSIVSLLQEITSKLNRLQNQLNSFIKKCPEQVEEFIRTNSKLVIHDNHSLMVEAKYMLSLIYGNVIGYQCKGLTFVFVLIYINDISLITHSSDLSEQLLQRKIDLCQSILKVYGAIDPGETNQRMNALFELSCATIIQTKIKLQRQYIRKDEAIVGKSFPVLKQNKQERFFLFRL